MYGNRRRSPPCFTCATSKGCSLLCADAGLTGRGQCWAPQQVQGLAVVLRGPEQGVPCQHGLLGIRKHLGNWQLSALNEIVSAVSGNHQGLLGRSEVGPVMCQGCPLGAGYPLGLCCLIFPVAHMQLLISTEHFHLLENSLDSCREKSRL